MAVDRWLSPLPLFHLQTPGTIMLWSFVTGSVYQNLISYLLIGRIPDSPIRFDVLSPAD